MTAAQVARKLKTTERYVWGLGRKNVLPRVVLPGGRLVRFRREDVEALILAGLGEKAKPPKQPGRFTRQGQLDNQTSMRF